MSVASEIGNRIRLLRRARGLSQTAFAEQVNAKQNTVSGWEVGDRFPDPDTLKTIAEALGVRMAVLVDDELLEEALSAMTAPKRKRKLPRTEPIRFPGRVVAPDDPAPRATSRTTPAASIRKALPKATIRPSEDETSVASSSFYPTRRKRRADD